MEAKLNQETRLKIFRILGDCPHVACDGYRAEGVPVMLQGVLFHG